MKMKGYSLIFCNIAIKFFDKNYCIKPINTPKYYQE